MKYLLDVDLDLDASFSAWKHKQESSPLSEPSGKSFAVIKKKKKLLPLQFLITYSLHECLLCVSCVLVVCIRLGVRDGKCSLWVF